MKETAKKELEKKWDAYEKKRAISLGEEYFDNVEASLKRALEDVRRHKKNWKLAVSGKKASSGYKPDASNIVNEIIWCNHNLANNMDFKESLAMRAVSRISLFFKIEV